MRDVTIHLTLPKDAVMEFGKLVRHLSSNSLGPGVGNLNLVTADEAAGAEKGVHLLLDALSEALMFPPSTKHDATMPATGLWACNGATKSPGYVVR
mgnify:CR=1 FL=1